MPESKKKKSYIQKIRNKYRLSIYRDETYEEVLNLKVSRLNAFTVIGLILLVFLAIVTSVIAYTPVRHAIPGYPDEITDRNIKLNKIRVDSLEIELERRDRYFDNMRRIIAGQEPISYENMDDTNIVIPDISFERSAEDSLIRDFFEEKGEYDLSVFENNTNVASISQMHFFPPIKGLVTNPYKSTDNHYGTDIVAAANEVVKSTLAGTVTFASWTLETGWVIQIQHEHNIVSMYKHNAELLKSVGDYVKVGEPIAIIGNSGELTTGPHLHFELWHNMVPLNPEDYISF